jgi:hypothetical protein
MESIEEMRYVEGKIYDSVIIVLAIVGLITPIIILFLGDPIGRTITYLVFALFCSLLYRRYIDFMQRYFGKWFNREAIKC